MSEPNLKGLFPIAANSCLPQEGQKLAQALNPLLIQVTFGEGKLFRSDWIVF